MSYDENYIGICIRRSKEIWLKDAKCIISKSLKSDTSSARKMISYDENYIGICWGEAKKSDTAMRSVSFQKEGRIVPRKGYIAKREILPDPIYNSKIVTKLINNVMLDGKKTVAQKIVYDAFDIIKEKTEKDPLEVFEESLNKLMPVLEVKARRIGGATYQVPLEIRPERRQTLGLRWLVFFARKRNEKTMAERLAAEIMDALEGNGGAFKRKEDMHKMAEANKAFAHYKF